MPNYHVRTANISEHPSRHFPGKCSMLFHIHVLRTNKNIAVTENITNIFKINKRRKHSNVNCLRISYSITKLSCNASSLIQCQIHLPVSSNILFFHLFTESTGKEPIIFMSIHFLPTSLSASLTLSSSACPAKSMKKQ